MDTVLLLKFAAAFAFVLSLMLGLSWLLKKLGTPGGGALGRKTDKRRLRVVESLQIDPRRRLVLVRRDDREHLLVLGHEGETVVEAGIPAEAGAEAGDDHVVSFARDHRNVKI